MQNAQVLSIDQEVARTVASEGGGEAPVVGEQNADTNPEATTVTLAVAPIHAEVLAVAETCGDNFSGRLALALRPLGDAGEVGTRSVWNQDGPPPTCAALLGLTASQ